MNLSESGLGKITTNIVLVTKSMSKFKQFVAELYATGKFCSCSEKEKVYDEIAGYYKLEIRHTRICRGRIIVMDLLQETSIEQV